MKRLPEHFGWKLCSELLKLLSSSLSAEESELYQRVVRNRDAAGLKNLAECWGPQSFALADTQKLQSVAVKYQLTRLLLKNSDYPTVEKNERRKNCLQQVKTCDLQPSAPILRDLGDPVFRRCKEIIRVILGDLPSVEEVSNCCRHGPGSTATIPYRLRCTYFKYARWPYGCSLKAKGLLKQCIQLDQRWLGSLEQSYREANGVAAWSILDQEKFWSGVIHDCNYNAITTVPKDGTKDRPIAKEPTGSVYIQLGLGEILKTRLLHQGVDLTDQTKNRELARLASIWDSPQSPCTLDLSNASDTVQRELVKALLPGDWFDMLDSVRSPYGKFPDGTGWIYSKMSSMGNGTTFELESLIFFALIRAVEYEFGDREDRAYTNVFGDDLIFPRYLSLHVQRYLEYFGFSVNATKSFTTGRFFESCGTDWFNGYNVRPVFLKSDPRNVMELLSIRNRLNRWMVRWFYRGFSEPLDVFFREYIDGPLDLYMGPESDQEFDSYWHRSDTRPDRRFKSLSRTPIAEQVGDVWFRKLMHDLKSCESESGNRFRISVADQGAMRSSQRVQPVPSSYSEDLAGW